jgi:hypothetical protein
MPWNFLGAATWGPAANPGQLQTHYWRIPFAGAPHICATAYLGQVGIGQQGARLGTVVASFKRYEFLDDHGLVQETELSTFPSVLEVNRCVSITIALDLEIAAGTGGWTFYTG